MIGDDDIKDQPSGHSSSTTAKTPKTAPDRGHFFIGPRTPAEANTADDDVTQFKRVHIVAAPDTRHRTATVSSSESTWIDRSVTGTDPGTYNSTDHRPPLPAPTESLLSDGNNETDSVSSTDSGIDAYSVPDDGTPITIRTNHAAQLPAPYLSIVNSIGPGESTLTPIIDDALSRHVIVYKHRDGQKVTMRIVTEEEEARTREEGRRLRLPVALRGSNGEEVRLHREIRDYADG